jgi:DNA-binding transcriptional LysR family regulator
MDRIDDFEAFIAIVDEGSLTAAARRLRRSLQSISRSLATIEKSMGIELVRRTTRQSSPTDAGTAFYRRIKPALLDISEAKLEASSRRAEPSGLLRIGASVLFAPPYIVPAIAAFMNRYPQLKVELRLSDRFVDLFEEGLDLAVRIGDMPASDLKAKRLGELRRVVFGSPGYFAKHGRPQRPADLARHQCLVRSVDRRPGTWPFCIAGKIGNLKVSGQFQTDHAAAINAAVVSGLGVGFSPLWQIRNLVDQGLVELILTDFEPPTIPIHAVWPGTKLSLAKTTLFASFLALRLKSERL